MLRLPIRSVVTIISLLAIGALVGALFSDVVRREARAAESISAGNQPVVVATTLGVSCSGSLASFSSSYAKVLDVGTFTVQNAGSIVDAAFTGRVNAVSLEPGVYGGSFELRIDDQPTANGTARATYQVGDSSVRNNVGVPAVMRGIFTNLSAGVHTVSIWVKGTVFGGGTYASADPGCWNTSQVVILEYKPFWGSYLPAVLRGAS